MLGDDGVQTLTSLKREFRLKALKPCVETVFDEWHASMTDTSAMDAAARRLTQALDALQSAVARKREAETGSGSLAAQIHVLGNDRARLASELDHTAAQARQLADTNREVARRIDVAISTIKTLLDEHDR